MQVLYYDSQNVPLKIWLNDISQAEPQCIEQALALTELPFAFHHVALMPDCHSGWGMPIGGVLATKEAILPNAVGVDIGCGMIFSVSDLPIDELDGSLLRSIVNDVKGLIPVGFSHHAKPQLCNSLDAALDLDFDPLHPLYKEIEKGYNQIGTLGGGNHFWELQKTDDNRLAVMIHSGSRNFGYQVCNYFVKQAQKLNEKWYSRIPNKDLVFLPEDSIEALDYLRWMNLCLDFAKENRYRMMSETMRVIEKNFPGIVFSDPINVHHNYVVKEHHFGQNVWVHRKGAIRARVGDYCIIPGAMGSSSYVGTGKGNPDSFDSCSHGAGRKMSRKAAREEFSSSYTLDDLGYRGIIFSLKDEEVASEESKLAYKNIDDVIAQESDLVDITVGLKTMAVIKG